MPTKPKIHLTPSQQAVVDYLRHRTFPFAAEEIARSLYGEDRSGVANTMRALKVLKARGLVGTGSFRNIDRTTACWSLTQKGRTA